MPCCYGYATTIKRAQGSTLDAVCLAFDRRRADRGYGYVEASRARSADNIFVVGKVRRTDWAPVGGNPDHEQAWPGAMSESTDREEEEEEDSLEECQR